MRRLAAILDSYTQLGCDARRTAVRARLAIEPRCAASQFLAGCLDIEDGRPASAVRHFMVARHVEWQLQSAALLVFAGLNVIDRPREPMLRVLLDTWEEFRRPQFDVYRKERSLLDRFHEPEPNLGALPPLARKLWRLPIAPLRMQIREAVDNRDAVLYPLLAAAL